MIKVNCGAIPSGLVESELFGHEKGAFTGAVAQKKGKFELAQHGTIFLDEIGDLPHDIQVKLLRVLQEQEFERVGGSQTIKVDVRVIAATNRDLQAEVKRGAFRSDLFFRLDIFPIRIPPLRARKEDIPLLTNFFIAKFSHRMGKRIQSINQKPLDALIKYHWPGNVRELANILERAVILCRGNVLRNEHIVGLTELEPSAAGIPLTLAEAERQHILQILKMTDGVVGGLNGAAAILGINRSTLRSRMQKLGIAVLKEVLHG
jgi:transcriptional regulator with GAF, ATPase, and Fis domain